MASTARPMAELPGSRPSKAREIIHAVYDTPPGRPLRAAVMELTEPLQGLFSPVVTCRLCLRVAAVTGTEITGGQL